MRIFEEFSRCPNCDHAFFFVKECVTINKEKREKLNILEPISRQELYFCCKCKEQFVIKEDKR